MAHLHSALFIQAIYYLVPFTVVLRLEP